MRQINDGQFQNNLVTALLVGSALLFTYLFIRAIRRPGLQRLQIFSAAIAGISLTACLMYLPGLYISFKLAAIGRSLIDWLPVRLFTEIHHPPAELILRLAITLFFLLMFIFLCRKRTNARLLQGMWLIFLMVNVAALALKTYYFLSWTEPAPPAPASVQDVRLNPAEIIMSHIRSSKKDVFIRMLYPLAWTVVSMIALIKVYRAGFSDKSNAVDNSMNVS